MTAVVAVVAACRRSTLAALCMLGLLAGCAQTPARPEAQATGQPRWSGRLALTVESEPVQSFSAAFELQGDAMRGELRLFSPLGSTLAVLTWTSDSATLSHDGQTLASASLTTLVMQVTGAEIPVRALVDWLGNMTTEVPGWQADLSQLPQGRLQVRRTLPGPIIDLRVRLDP